MYARSSMHLYMSVADAKSADNSMFVVDPRSGTSELTSPYHPRLENKPEQQCRASGLC